MLRSWIRNSISPELQSLFVYAPSALALWECLKEKYGQVNAIQVYQLKRTISNHKQGELFVTTYYTKFWALNDELQAMQPTPPCTCNGCICEVKILLTSLQNKNKLM